MTQQTVIVMSDTAWPEALQEIIELFEDADPEERLEILLEFAMAMPDLPEDLQNARDSMEQVHECQSPVFLLAKLEDGKVFYHLDVPREAPTVRGFAGILHQALSGAKPEAITATPNDLYQRMGLHKVLSPLRLRGLTALLGRMKRNAQELAGTTGTAA
jgi:cysteine desulfuration protein SufE